MKKFFLFLACAVAMLAQSCQQTDDYGVSLKDSAVVTFTADLGSLGTRAAISDGMKVNEIAWAVYLHGADSPLPDLHGTLPVKDRKAELQLRLATGKSYDIALFAYYTADAATQQVSYANDATVGTPNPAYYSVLWNEKKVCIQYPVGTLANDTDNRDCFWYVKQDLEVTGNIEETFTLTRPLAQLNFGSSAEDTLAAQKAGLEVGYSKIVASTYTQFNMFTGLCTDAATTEFTFEKGAVPTQKLTVKDKKSGTDVDYTYLGTVYLLVNDSDLHKSTTLTVYDTAGAEINSATYTNMPFTRNWRTNIIGNLLTNPAEFTILVDEEFVNDHNQFPFNGSLKAITPNAKGEYTVTCAEELAWVSKQVRSGAENFEGKSIVLDSSLSYIDLNGHNGIIWHPIGSKDNPFRGSFDGNGVAIRNMVVNNTEYAGLFGAVISPSIKGVKIENATITSGHFAGAVAGWAYTNITGCSVDGLKMTVAPYDTAAVRAAQYDNGDKAGGIVGYVGPANDTTREGHTISGNTVTNAVITAYRDLGGIVGAGYIKECKGNNISKSTLTVDQSGNECGTKDANLDELVGRLVNSELVKVLDSENTISDVTLVYNPDTLNPNRVTPEIESVSPATVEFADLGGEETITVTVKGNATLSATSSDESWLTATANTTDNTVTLTASANNGDAREATVIIKYGDSSKTVTVKQKEVTPAITVTEGAELSFKAIGGTLTAKYTLVGEATLSVEDVPTWATVTTDNGTLSVKANFSVEKNERNATITLKYGNDTAEVELEQEVGKIYLKVNSNWQASNARFEAYGWDNGNAWTTAVKSTDVTDCYEISVAELNSYNFLFCRMNPNGKNGTWDSKWDQTVDLKISSEANLYTIEENTLYFQPNNTWKSKNGRYATWTWSNNEDGSWTNMTEYEDGIYKSTFSSGHNKAIFCVMKNTTNNWDNKLEQTGDLEILGSNYAIQKDDNNIEWKTIGVWSALQGE